jgi:hypothetical protein
MDCLYNQERFFRTGGTWSTDDKWKPDPKWHKIDFYPPVPAKTKIIKHMEAVAEDAIIISES